MQGFYTKEWRNGARSTKYPFRPTWLHRISLDGNQLKPERTHLSATWRKDTLLEINFLPWAKSQAHDKIHLPMAKRQTHGKNLGSRQKGYLYVYFALAASSSRQIDFLLWAILWLTAKNPLFISKHLHSFYMQLFIFHTLNFFYFPYTTCGTQC
jgi:hypothetical protein